MILVEYFAIFWTIVTITVIGWWTYDDRKTKKYKKDQK